MRALLFLPLLACQEQTVQAPVDAGTAPVADAGPPPLDASVVHLPGDGSTPESAGLSCEDILAQRDDPASAAYWINPLGGPTSNAYQVYCDFDAEDGPWTLVVKIDGSQKTFGYEEALWTNETVLAPESAAPGDTESKNHGYSQLAYTSIRLGMRVAEDEEEGDGITRYITLATRGDSLRQTMVRGEAVNTELGIEAWRSLIPLTSMQANCHAEGIMVQSSLRFGILGNQEDDCNTPDSFIAIGSNQDAVVAGNLAHGRWAADNGDRRTKAFAEIWVQHKE